MTKVIYGESSQEINKMQETLHFIDEVFNDSYLTDEYKEEMVLDARKFIRSIRFDMSAEGVLDTALIGEIGKAYKTQYDLAVETDNDVMKERMHGAMFAIKKIMEMVKDQSV